MRANTWLVRLTLIATCLIGLASMALWLVDMDRSRYSVESIVDNVSAGNASGLEDLSAWLASKFPQGTRGSDVVDFFKSAANDAPAQWWILPSDQGVGIGEIEEERRWVGVSCISKLDGYKEVLVMKAYLDSEERVIEWRWENNALVGEWTVENGKLRMVAPK